MKKLHFLVPSVYLAKTIVFELRNRGIPQRHIHVVGNIITPLCGLPEAPLWQKTELIHGIEAGLAWGGVAGFLGSICAITLPPAGLVLGGGSMLATALAGAGFGALVSGLIAKDIPNKELEAYAHGIGNGQLLMIVDIPKVRTQEISILILERHPDASLGEADYAALFATNQIRKSDHYTDLYKPR